MAIRLLQLVTHPHAWSVRSTGRVVAPEGLDETVDLPDPPGRHDQS
jgi:hypothetical protein